MLLFIFSSVTAFIISLATLPVVVGVSRKKNFLILPGGRRMHTRDTPTMGGISIFLGFVLALLFFTPADQHIQTLWMAGVVCAPALAGLADDLYHLRPRYKLAGQFLLGTLAFFMLDVRLSSLYGLFPLEPFAPVVSYLVTVFAVIAISNSFNLIDGVDGLAGTVALLALVFFGIWFSLVNQILYATVCFSLTGALLAFLFLNWEPAKIFMGETGSLLLGFLLSVLVIEFMNVNSALPNESRFKFSSTVGTALCVLVVPLTDTVRIIVLRLSKGLSPFVADKRHIHHCLVRIGLTHRLTVAVLAVAQIAFIMTAVLLRKYDDIYVLSFATVTASLLCLALDATISKHTYNKR